MRLQWKELPRGDIQAQWSGFYVTLNPKGRLALGRRVYEKMNEPKAFNILFCAANNIIGLKPCQPKMRNAYLVCRNRGESGRHLNANRLIREYRLSLPQAIQFVDPEIDHDGILQLDLRTAIVSSRSAKHFTRTRGDTSRAADGRFSEPATETDQIVNADSADAGSGKS
jgi:hypothetical protein